MKSSAICWIVTINIYECACDKFIENSADFDCQRQSLCNIYVIFLLDDLIYYAQSSKRILHACVSNKVWRGQELHNLVIETIL